MRALSLTMILVFGALPIVVLATKTRGHLRRLPQFHNQVPEWKVVSNPRFPNRTADASPPTAAPVKETVPSPPPRYPRRTWSPSQEVAQETQTKKMKARVNETYPARKEKVEARGSETDQRKWNETVKVVKAPPQAKASEKGEFPDKCPTGGLHPDIELLIRNMKTGPVRASSNVTMEPAATRNKGPHYVFITGMPYSGTTALYGLVSTSPHASNLCSGLGQCCEGGPLLLNEGYIPYNVPTDPRYPRDWDEAVKIYERHWNMSAPIVVEKSVTNLYRFPKIWATLKKRHARVTFVYLARSKCFYNHPDLWYSWRAEIKDVVEMAEVLRRDGAGFHIVKDEDMLSDPYSFANKLLGIIPELESLDPMLSGLHSAPYVNQSKWAVGQGDFRALSVASYVYLKRFFLTQFPGLPFTSFESLWMQKLGYTRQYFAHKPFAKGYLTSGAPFFSDDF